MEEPNTFQEANSDAAWRTAMKDELDSIEGNGTWELTPLPPGQKSIGLKWVYKIKDMFRSKGLTLRRCLHQ
jgi:hypothetical protein